MARIDEHDEIVASFRLQQRGMDLATVVLVVGGALSFASHVALGHTWPTYVIFVSWLVLSAGTALWAATDRARRAFRRGPWHRGVLVTHGAGLFELRTKDGSLWMWGPYVEHAALPMWHALLRRDPREVTVVGPIRTTGEVPAEIAGTSDYRGGASVQVIAGTLEHPAWIFGAKR